MLFYLTWQVILEPEHQGGKRVISFLRHQIENELEWIMTFFVLEHLKERAVHDSSRVDAAR